MSVRDGDRGVIFTEAAFVAAACPAAGSREPTTAERADAESYVRAFLAAHDRDALATAVVQDVGDDDAGACALDWSDVRAVIDALFGFDHALDARKAKR